MEVEQVVARFLGAASRSATVVRRMGSTDLIRNGSMIVRQRSTRSGYGPKADEDGRLAWGIIRTVRATKGLEAGTDELG